METVTLSSKGQLVLPKSIRDRLSLSPGGRLMVSLVDGKVVLEPIYEKTRPGWRKWGGALRGEPLLTEHMAEHNAEVTHDEKGT
ncbi:MAG TPA: AbrB/MazE/SpoVT family DNA-binding domain-containing protein [Clostridia bacterium]|nr:AbrB/MazE/SpoVT family DNA-binding domain-containing protein [Clostridia bacterium]